MTLNNYDEEDIERFRGLCAPDGSTEYGVFGKEVGESGTHHLQVYLYFKKRLSLRQVKLACGGRVHAEVARGNPRQASDYCKKDGKYEEFGRLPGGSGARVDVASAVKLVREGATKTDLLEGCPVLLARYPRFFNELFLTCGKSREWKTEVFVYYGETGVGKTRKAFEEAVGPYVHSGGEWFDGYSGEPDVIFDDFGGSEFKLTYLLKLLDRYPMKVPVKGGFVNWIPYKIWITSNYPPKDWFPNAKDEHVRALLRRLTKVVRFRSFAAVLGVNADDYDDEVIVQ